MSLPKVQCTPLETLFHGLRSPTQSCPTALCSYVCTLHQTTFLITFPKSEPSTLRVKAGACKDTGCQCCTAAALASHCMKNRRETVTHTAFLLDTNRSGPHPILPAQNLFPVPLHVSGKGQLNPNILLVGQGSFSNQVFWFLRYSYLLASIRIELTRNYPAAFLKSGVALKTQNETHPFLLFFFLSSSAFSF